MLKTITVFACLMLCLSAVRSTPDISFLLDNDFSLDLTLTRGNQKKFLQCMCTENNSVCNLIGHGDWYFRATKVLGFPKPTRDRYRSVYVCRAPSAPGPNKHVRCARQTRRDSPVCRGPGKKKNSSCRVHHMDLSRFRSCDIKCLDIIWTNAKEVKYGFSLRGTSPQKGRCKARVPPTKPSLPPETSTAVVVSRNSGAAEALSSGLVVVLVIAVIVVVAVLVGVRLVVKRRSQLRREKKTASPSLPGTNPGDYDALQYDGYLNYDNNGYACTDSVLGQQGNRSGSNAGVDDDYDVLEVVAQDYEDVNTMVRVVKKSGRDERGSSSIGNSRKNSVGDGTNVICLYHNNNDKSKNNNSYRDGGDGGSDSGSGVYDEAKLSVCLNTNEADDAGHVGTSTYGSTGGTEYVDGSSCGKPKNTGGN